VTITRADRLYSRKDELSQPLLNRLVRLAALQNPHFYKAQAMRMPVWDTPRVIGRTESYPLHVALLRECLDPAMDLLKASQRLSSVSDHSACAQTSTLSKCPRIGSGLAGRAGLPFVAGIAGSTDPAKICRGGQRAVPVQRLYSQHRPL
jgi:hypothetical protein